MALVPGCCATVMLMASLTVAAHGTGTLNIEQPRIKVDTMTAIIVQV
ncbi:MAG: hypothetical protein VKK97_07890 [Synechococcaceae cyanobacterium]|nr:hypothetical protein [Synechococcaceae cyanobacterium]